MTDDRDPETPEAPACLSAEHGGATFALHPPTPFALAMVPSGCLLMIAIGTGALDLEMDRTPRLRRLLKPDEVVLAPAGSHFAARHVAPLEFLIVTLPSKRIGELAQRAGLGANWSPPDMPFWRDPCVAVLGAEMRRAMIAEGLPMAGYLAALADALLVNLITDVSRQQVEPPPDALAPAVLGRVVAHMEANLAADLTVADLADVAGFSTAHFARAFAHTTGDPPMRFLMKRRLCRARDLLSGTRFGIADIAVKAGFASQAHLSTAFARHVGLTPAKYRASFRTGAGADDDNDGERPDE
jgi:AraC family transcriptional regulator